MCGITGVFNLPEGEPVPRHVLDHMADALMHRGPDDQGYYLDEQVGFAFRRLSIIDLGGGAQPMFNEDGSLVLICNGEIYNYKSLRRQLQQAGHIFRSECDVEVILHLYEEEGAAFISRLNGQFAFALYDKRKGTLLLARDHTGIAPLFYTSSNDGPLVFGSEIKAIVRHPSVRRKVDPAGLDQLLSFPGVVSPTTMFAGISSLKPGHYLVATATSRKIYEYWDLEYPREQDVNYPYTDKYYEEQLEDLLQQAVNIRLNADVPVGFYLSGGLDSSLIAALIARHDKGQARHSFSISFADTAIDEKRYRDYMLPVLGSQHHELMFHHHDIASRLQSAVYHAETPLKESYNTCSLALSEEVKRSNIKVVLTGEGADELFAGYVGYKFDKNRIQHAAVFADQEETYERENRQMLWGHEHFIYEKNYHAYGDLKRTLYSSHLNDTFASFDSVKAGLVNKSRLEDRNDLHIRSYLDFKLRLSDHLVADHGDRVSYANSVEARYPFLDINVIEFSRHIPPWLKLNGMMEKHILKQCARKYVPTQIVEREKFSFVAPGSHYLLKENIPWVNDMLSYDRIKRLGYFDPDVIERLKRMYLADSFNLNQTFETDLLMIVLTFSIFCDQFQMKTI
jgi:asparagine synthase (glutamine-hydrolysing)